MILFLEREERLSESSLLCLQPSLMKEVEMKQSSEVGALGCWWEGLLRSEGLSLQCFSLFSCDHVVQQPPAPLARLPSFTLGPQLLSQPLCPGSAMSPATLNSWGESHSPAEFCSGVCLQEVRVWDGVEVWAIFLASRKAALQPPVP